MADFPWVLRHFPCFLLVNDIANFAYFPVVCALNEDCSLGLEGAPPSRRPRTKLVRVPCGGGAWCQKTPRDNIRLSYIKNYDEF